MGNIIHQNQIDPNSIPILDNKKKYLRMFHNLENKNYDSEVLSQMIDHLITPENINQKNSKGNTILLFIISNFSGLFLFQMVNLLLNKGADPNLKGNCKINSQIYSHAFPPDVKNKKTLLTYNDVSPLYLLTRHLGSQSLINTINSLVYFGAICDFNFFDYIKYYRFQNQYDLEILNQLIENNLNVTDIYYLHPNMAEFTSLMLTNIASLSYAQPELQKEILLRLIRAGVNTKFKNQYGKGFLDTFNLKQHQLKHFFTDYLNQTKSANLFISRLCLICYEETSQLCLTDCGHAVTCEDCFGQLIVYKCPYCNQQFTSHKVIKFLAS